MQAQSKLLNLQRSLYKYLKDNLSSSYYINYSYYRDPNIQNYNQWIDIHWINTESGWGPKTIVRLNCCSIIKEDQYGVELAKMRDEVINVLNIDEIQMYDFSTDPLNPTIIDGVSFYPRYDKDMEMPNEAGDTVAVWSIDFRIYWWRPDINP